MPRRSRRSSVTISATGHTTTPHQAPAPHHGQRHDPHRAARARMHTHASPSSSLHDRLRRMQQQLAFSTSAHHSSSRPADELAVDLPAPPPIEIASPPRPMSSITAARHRHDIHRAAASHRIASEPRRRLVQQSSDDSVRIAPAISSAAARPWAAPGAGSSASTSSSHRATAAPSSTRFALPPAGSGRGRRTPHQCRSQSPRPSA